MEGVVELCLELYRQTNIYCRIIYPQSSFLPSSFFLLYSPSLVSFLSCTLFLFPNLPFLHSSFLPSPKITRPNVRGVPLCRHPGEGQTGANYR